MTPPTKWLSLLILFSGTILLVAGVIMIAFGYTRADKNPTSFLKIGGIIFTSVGLLALTGGCVYFTFVRGRHSGKLDQDPRPAPPKIPGQTREEDLLPVREWLRRNLSTTPRRNKKRFAQTPRDVLVTLKEDQSIPPDKNSKSPQTTPGGVDESPIAVPQESVSKNDNTVMQNGTKLSTKSKSVKLPPLRKESRVNLSMPGYEDLLQPSVTQSHKLDSISMHDVLDHADSGSMTNVFTVTDSGTSTLAPVPKTRSRDLVRRSLDLPEDRQTLDFSNTYTRHSVRITKKETMGIPNYDVHLDQKLRKDHQAQTNVPPSLGFVHSHLHV
jgi:hypothetical protein